MPKLKIAKRSVDALKVTGERYVAMDTELAGFCVRVSTVGRKVYGFRYRAGGGRSGRARWYTIGTHGAITADQARDIAREVAAEVARGGDPAGEKRVRRDAPTVSDLLDLYLADHVEKKNKPSTAKNARILVDKLIRPALGRLKVADTTVGDVAKFHSAHASTPYQANRALSVLSKAFALSEVWGMRPNGSNPCRMVERFKEQSRERFLSPAEFKRLGSVLAQAERMELRVKDEEDGERLAHVNPEAIRAIRLLIFTGARVSEILGLRWEYIDLETGRANLPDSKTGKKVLQLPAPALGALANAGRPESGKGFVIRGGDASSSEAALVNLKDPWRVIRKAAGLEDVRLHDLRHAFASVAAVGGFSLPMIGALLGHRETRTTQRYAHLADDPQKAAADQIAGRISDAMGGADGGGVVIELRGKR